MFIVLDYLCTKCDTREERFVRKSDRNSQRCEECGSEVHEAPSGTKTHFRFADPSLKK